MSRPADRRWWALAALVLSVLTIGFDITILNVALPTIATDLAVGADALQLRFAQRYPDRVTRRALLAPGGLDVKDIWEFRLLRLPLLGELAVRLPSTASVRHLLRKAFARHERIPDDLIGQVVGELRSGRNRAARRAAMLRVERSVSWTDIEAELQLVRAPVLLLWGSKDRYSWSSSSRVFVMSCFGRVHLWSKGRAISTVPARIAASAKVDRGAQRGSRPPRTRSMMAARACSGGQRWLARRWI